MTAEANNPEIEEDDDLNTTAPNPVDDDLSTTAPNPPHEPVWKMPEPVFRRTSGKLPEGYEKNYAPTPADPESRAVVEGPPAVEAYSSPPPPVVKPKSSVLKLILVLLGIAAMTAFLVVFLTFVYFFFLRSPD
jgi:hypothetical protein